MYGSGCIDQLNDFEKKYPAVTTEKGFTWGTIKVDDKIIPNTLYSTQYTSKQLELVLPDMPMSTEQAQVIQKFIDDYGISIVIMRG